MLYTEAASQLKKSDESEIQIQKLSRFKMVTKKVEIKNLSKCTFCAPDLRIRITHQILQRRFLC